jgi:hypothetical protein
MVDAGKPLEIGDVVRAMRMELIGGLSAPTARTAGERNHMHVYASSFNIASGPYFANTILSKRTRVILREDMSTKRIANRSGSTGPGSGLGAGEATGFQPAIFPAHWRPKTIFHRRIPGVLHNLDDGPRLSELVDQILIKCSLLPLQCCSIFQ